MTGKDARQKGLACPDARSGFRPLLAVSSFLEKLKAWLRLKKLKHEFRRSQRFQKACEKLKCFNLAEAERRYRLKIEDDIKRSKQLTLHHRS